MPERVHQRSSTDLTLPGNGKSKKSQKVVSLATSKKRKRKTSNPSQAALSVGTSSTSKSAQGSAFIQDAKTVKPTSGLGDEGQKSRGISKAKLGIRSTSPALRPKSSNVHIHLKDKAKALWPIRRRLPIWSHVSEIKAGLQEKDIMLLVGETGSGKSTQVPQMLIDEPWCRSCKVKVATGTEFEETTVGGCIAITEPRRVAAITLARRVAEEMGTPLGSSSQASTVGYSVRFDNSTSPNTKVKFLTEGMLLQEMLRDPWLRKYSAVVVDEVHERGVNVDLVLGFLQRMVREKYRGRDGIPLKVVVMSATAEMEKLKDFFEGAYALKSYISQNMDGGIVQQINGFKLCDRASEQVIDQQNVESDLESEWPGIASSDEERQDTKDSNPETNGFQQSFKNPQSKPPDGRALNMIRINGHKASDLNLGSDDSNISLHKDGRPAHIATCHIEGRQFPVEIQYAPEPVQDFVDAALRTIFQIHYKEPMPGDILVFLTGQETVESLENLVKEYALGMGPEVPKVLVLPLFAALPQAAQQRVFQPAPSKTRKVILATNIAETSITVSGVRFVIDCGKAKTKQFRTNIGLDSLLVKPISKSSAIQRKGRAGREGPGRCYRLYTEQSYLDLAQLSTPEILRCDLSQAILSMKARGIDDILNFPFLDRPPREALEKALLQLFHLEALAESGTITEIGHQMAKLPLTVSLGRALVAAAEPELDCVPEVIDIISCLSVENVFVNLTSEEKKEEAEIARRELFRREGDHLTLLATIQAYAAENSDRKFWAEKHFVSHRAMQSVMAVRKQLRAQCQQYGILSKQAEGQESTIALTQELATSILKSFLKGFRMNTAVLIPDGSYRTVIGKQTVAIHPSSGLFGRKVEAIMYNEFVFTNRSYARGVSAIQMNWIEEAIGV